MRTCIRVEIFMASKKIGALQGLTDKDYTTTGFILLSPYSGRLANVPTQKGLSFCKTATSAPTLPLANRQKAKCS